MYMNGVETINTRLECLHLSVTSEYLSVVIIILFNYWEVLFFIKRVEWTSRSLFSLVLFLLLFHIRSKLVFIINSVIKFVAQYNNYQIN